ncbi:hypothetical protein I4528_25895 [Klebsiella oxytoca]|nr:hypothetical protein [Klebsiella oxytoca]
MEKLIALKHKLDAIKAMGTNAKKEALAGMDDFEQRMVSLMLNPFVRFGVKKYKVADPLSKSVPSDQKAIELLEKLAARELTGTQPLLRSSLWLLRCVQTVRTYFAGSC